jgi:hypothetical protein
MITKEQAIERLVAIEEFCGDLRKFLLDAEETEGKDAPAPEKATKKAEKTVEPPKQEEKAPEVAEKAPDYSEIIEEYGLNDMSVKDMKEILESYGIEFNKSAKKKDYFIELIASNVANGTISDEEEEESEEEEEADETEAPEEEAEVPATKEPEDDSPIALKEKEVEEKIRADYKAKKLKDTEIKKFLKKYYDGDPDCADCKGCSKEEILQCYIDIQKNLVDDDAELNELESAYMREGEVFCCGQVCQMLENGNAYCEICASEYEVE